MTKGPAFPGSPCSTATFAPLGIDGGASVHLISLALMKVCVSLAPCANAGPARTAQAIKARVTARFLSIDIPMVALLLSRKERRHDGAEPVRSAMRRRGLRYYQPTGIMRARASAARSRQRRVEHDRGHVGEIAALIHTGGTPHGP